MLAIVMPMNVAGQIWLLTWQHSIGCEAVTIQRTTAGIEQRDINCYEICNRLHARTIQGYLGPGGVELGGAVRVVPEGPEEGVAGVVDEVDPGHQHLARAPAAAAAAGGDLRREGAGEDEGLVWIPIQ
jgi:hypothetical protein